jgi:hypothetical protein
MNTYKINTEKAGDIQTLTEYIPEEYQNVYHEIISWKTYEVEFDENYLVFFIFQRSVCAYITFLVHTSIFSSFIILIIQKMYNINSLDIFKLSAVQN